MLLMLRGSDDQGPNNWRRLWESNKKSCLQAAKAWLQQLSSNPSSLGTLSIPPSTSDSPEAVTMSNNSMNQSLEDQFLHWRQDMEKKQDEQARQMKELQGHTERLQRENDQLRAQIEKAAILEKMFEIVIKLFI